MSIACRAKCAQYRAVRGNHYQRYSLGQKRCTTCDIFIEWDGLRCPCCNTMLRIKARLNRSRRKLVRVKRY